MIHQPSSLSGPEEGLLATTQPDPKLTDGSVRSGQFLTDTPLRSPVRPVLEAELLRLTRLSCYLEDSHVNLTNG